MGNLINLAVYNPAILDDNEFLEGFVARSDLTERLLNRLREVTPKNVARHLLVIGQRGMGKTSMLRRLALGVANDPALSEVLIPLTFREEQYNVHNLHVFWCNCLDALGDYLEKIGRHDQATQLDREIGKLADKGGDPDGIAAKDLFKEACAKEGKRPLLLLDNIDLIFSGLKEQQQWGLRRILQERGGVVVTGASSGLMEDTIRPEAPFYDFFQVHQLEKLSHPELLSCLRQIALKRGEQGKRVLRVLDTDPARIHTLYDLTGGNPRTLVLLYLLLELDSEGDVMDDLERLLDQVTALYKARVEDLAPQTRVVLDAVALGWNPVTVAQVAAETGLESTSISSQFDRLIKMGILEKVSLSTPAPTGYQLGERFFNIWYLMRNASRRMRNRLRWLTEFLRRLYSPQQISEMADEFIRRSKGGGRCSGVYGMALAEAVKDDALRHAMNHHVTRIFHEQADARCEKLDKLVDRNDLDQTTLTMAEAKKLVLNCKRDWGGTTAEEFWDVFGGSIYHHLKCKRGIIFNIKTIETNQIESIVNEEIARNSKVKRELELSDAFECLRNALRDGILGSGGDLAHALSAAKEFDCPELPLVMIHLNGCESLSLPSDIAQAMVESVSFLFGQQRYNFNSVCYFDWGRFLFHNKFIAEAEHALSNSIKLSPTKTSPWIELGNLFSDQQRFGEAECAYRKATELDPKNALPWNNLGILLQGELNRNEESEQAFRKAIELDPKDAELWNNLGNLLQEELNRYEEAEQAFRKAIELDPEDANSWNNLGNLLKDELNRYEEAEHAFRKAIEFSPEGIEPWNNLGNLLQDHLHRPKDAGTAYLKAIELGDETVLPKANLAYLLLSQATKIEEAESAYNDAISLLPEHGRQLLTSFRALARDNFGEAMQNLGKALEENHPELFTVYQDDFLRNLRLAKSKGYGERLLTYLQESGLNERHWPLYAAFDAYLHGEAKLRDVNPEVRGAAKRIFDWMMATPEMAAPTLTTAKKRGRKATRKQ